MLNKKMLCAATSIFMAVLMVVLSLSMPVGALTQVATSNENKIDAVLQKKLDEMSDTDTISVSVWFNDINYDKLRTNIENETAKISAVDSVPISKDAIDLLFYDVENTVSVSTEAITELKDLYSDVTSEEIQAAVVAERKVAAEMYKEHNQDMIADVLSSTNLTVTSATAAEGSEESRVQYICKYAPNADMVLTKAQILDIVNSDSVEEVNYRSTNLTATAIELPESDSMQTLSDTITTYDTPYFTATGLDTARDTWRLNGEGMHIGMLEIDGVVIESFVGKDVNNIALYNFDDTSFHATQIALILVGNKTAVDENGDTVEVYTGAVPRANLHAVALKGQFERLKPAVEALLSEGVTVISSSSGFFEEGISSAYYNDTAKWYDYISTNRNVHLALCAGNKREGKPYQVVHSNNAYNAVVVGNCNNNGELYLGLENSIGASLYNQGITVSYKPDIVAPGVSIMTQVTDMAGPTGTSFSTPMVASAMIQLSQASPILQANPTLMKAVLISSSKIKASMSTEPMISAVNGTNIAYSRPYGAGMLSVTNAYTAFITKGYYATGTFSPYSTGVRYNKSITKSVGKTIRICATWDKVSTTSEVDGVTNVNSSKLDTLVLKVTTPSGNVYRSTYIYDNKQMISFVSTENGTYTIDLDRGSAVTSGSIIDYSIAWSVQ